MSADGAPTLRGSLLRHYGGKGACAQRIYPHFARAEVYVEPFFGGGGMFFSLPEGLYGSVTVNDLDSLVVSFFKMLRDRPRELLQACELTPWSREEFIRCAKAKNDEGLDELERARMLWVLSRQGVIPLNASEVGGWRSRRCGTKPDPVRDTETKLQLLLEYARRMRGVQVEQRDAIELVDLHDRKGVMIYSDPPYVPETRAEGSKSIYRHEMTVEQHAALATSHKRAAAAGARVCVSGYAGPLYETLYAGWRRVDVAAGPTTSAVTMTSGAERRENFETLWMSYPASEEINLGARSTPRLRTAREKALFKAAMVLK